MGTCGRRFRRALSIKLSVFNKIVTYQKNVFKRRKRENNNVKKMKTFKQKL